MGKDTIADIITSIRNADMNRKGTIQIGSIYLYLTYQLQILQIKSESLYFDLIYEMNPVFRFLAYFVTELS